MLHIVQNDPEVPPGNIVDTLDSRGMIHVVHHPYCGDPLPDLQDISALIVLGGAMGALDDVEHPFLYDLKILIGQVAKAGIPYLGICLGGQLLAAALGTNVVSNRWEEVGSGSVTLTDRGREDALFSGLSDSIETFQWHHDSFDLPADAILLATGPVCPHQAFRYGSRAWGTQFHPEVTEQIIRDWCAWDPSTSGRVEVLLHDFRAIRPQYEKISHTMITNFLSVAQLI